MKSFLQKRRFKGILESKPVLVFLGLIMLVFVFGVVGFMGKMQTTIENKRIVENKLLELKKEKDKLSLGIAKLNSKDGIEESIRDKFGLVKDGEGVIIIVEDKNQVKIKEKSSGGFFNMIKNFFK